MNKQIVLIVIGCLICIVIVLSIFIYNIHENLVIKPEKQGNYKNGYNLGDIMNIPRFIDEDQKKKYKGLKEGSYMGLDGYDKNILNEILKQYPRSIFAKYYEESQKMGLDIFYRPNFDLLKEILKTYPNPISDPNTLVIHIRLGDKGRLLNQYKNKILQVTKNNKPTTIILLCGLHNNPDHKKNPNLYKNTNKDLDVLKNMLKPYANIIHKQNDADTDLVTMYYAPKLLVHRGGFSALGGFVCKGEVFFSDEYSHLKYTKKYRNNSNVYYFNGKSPNFVLEKFNRKVNTKVVKSLQVLDHNKDTYVISEFRNDLLGAFLQGILLSIITKSREYNLIIAITDKQFSNFNGFTNQNIARLADKGKETKNIWNTVGNESEFDHLNFRKKIVDMLFRFSVDIPSKVKNITLNNYELDKLDLNQRTALLNTNNTMEVFKKFRELLADYLPSFIKSNKDRGYIAIHYRAGEITNISSRFTHSSQYENILKYIQYSYNLPIFIFTSIIPSNEVDNLATFKKYNTRIITDKDSNTLNTLASFVHADIFIMAKSSFSYISCLLRDHFDKITFYRDFWHKKPHINIYDWDENGSGEKQTIKPNYIVQMYGGKYNHIPKEISSIWIDIFPTYKYKLMHDKQIEKFIEENFENDMINAFKNGISPHKYDLARYLFLSKYQGIYCDVDAKPQEILEKEIIQMADKIDTIMVIGAITPSVGIKNLPPAELFNGFIVCFSPDPMLEQFVRDMGANKVANGQPYAFNIQNHYIWLCKRFKVDKLKPYHIYYDLLSGRRYYFLKEFKGNQKANTNKEGAYWVKNNKGQNILDSQRYSKDIFQL